MIPSTYRPAGVDDFIGPARAWASHLAKLVAKAKPDRAPLAIAFLGWPGIGKSALADYTANLLGSSKWSMQEKNGASFRIEDVEEWQRSMHFCDLFGEYRIFRIEEVDRASQAAQVALLTMLDRLPKGNAFLVTTNKPMADLETRFARRFTLIELAPPKPEEITSFLHDKFGLAQEAAHTIGQWVCRLDLTGSPLGGFVGQALKEADAVL